MYISSPSLIFFPNFNESADCFHSHLSFTNLHEEVVAEIISSPNLSHDELFSSEVFFFCFSFISPVKRSHLWKHLALLLSICICKFPNEASRPEVTMGLTLPSGILHLASSHHKCHFPATYWILPWWETWIILGVRRLAHPKLYYGCAGPDGHWFYILSISLQHAN